MSYQSHIQLNKCRGESPKHCKMELCETKDLLDRMGNGKQSEETVSMVEKMSMLTMHQTEFIGRL